VTNAAVTLRVGVLGPSRAGQTWNYWGVPIPKSGTSRSASIPLGGTSPTLRPDEVLFVAFHEFSIALSYLESMFASRDALRTVI
jgi:hypothetical protein